MVINEVKKEREFDHKVNYLNPLTTSKSERVLEDEYFLKIEREREEKLIAEANLKRKEMVKRIKEQYGSVNKIRFQAKVDKGNRKIDQELDLERSLVEEEPQKNYESEMQEIYKNNITNLVKRSQDLANNTELQHVLFKNTKENQAMQITEKDLKILDEYEKLLFKQNETVLFKLRAGGQTMLKPRERNELL